MAAPELRVAVSAIEASALFQVDGDLTRGGLPVPRMATVQRDAIATPVTGLLIYNTTTSAYNFYNGAAWVSLGSSGGGAPADATFITQTPSSGLSAEQALSLLATGYMKSATTTGVITTQAVPIPATDGGTGVVSPTAHNLLVGNGASAIATLAPSTARKVAISDGTDWTSRALAALDLTAALVSPPDIGGTTPANVTASQLALKAIGAVTISSGAVTITQSFESIAPESGSSDDLDTLSGAAAGKIVVIRPTSTNVIRVTTAGNVVTPDGAAITLSGSTQALTLIYDDGQSKWIVIGRQTLGLAGVTSRIEPVFFADTSSVIGAGKTGLVYNTSGLTCYYSRNKAASTVAVTLATMTPGTWASGGFVERDATHMPGSYQIGIPDAALAVGSDGSTSVEIQFVLSAPASAVARPIVLPLS